MSDSIEAAISSSIASLPGSDASSGSSSSSDATDTPDTSSSSDDTASTGSTGAVADGAVTEKVTPGAADTPVAEVAATPADDTLEGLAKELAGKRDNRIPHSRVVKITEKAVAEATAKVQAQYEAEVAPYRSPEFQNGLVAMQVADQDPGRFLQAMAEADPRYAELLAGSRALAGAGGAQPAAAGKGAPKAVAAPEGDVEPDIQLADGTLGFSAEAAVRREAALVARLTSEFKEMMAESLKPVEPILSERRQNQLRHEAAGRVSERITAAEKWPGFTENKEGIAAAITEASKRGQKLDLHDAYIQVVIPKFRADHARVRAEVVAEQNASAAATTRLTPGGRGKVETAAASDVDPVEAAIRDSIRGMK